MTGQASFFLTGLTGLKGLAMGGETKYSCEMLRVELDPLWPSLSDGAREEASAWADIARRMGSAADKGAELARCRADYSGLLGRVGRGTVYRRIGGVRRLGLEGAVSKAELRRARGSAVGLHGADPALPAGFVAWWGGCAGRTSGGSA